MNRFAALLVPLALLFGGTGCIVETGDPAPIASSSGPVSPDPIATPQVAVIDPDRTLTATPGDGVGVFVEYRTGGTWTVSWTCDTARSSQRCPYTIHVTGNALALVDQNIARGTASGGGSSLTATSDTDYSVDHVSFTATPGARILLEASIGSLHDGSYLFFVQDGKVNGGYAGKLSNPIYLEPKKP